MLGDVRSWAERQKAPVTIALIASLIVSSLYFWFSHLKGMDSLMIGADSGSRPWSFLTYPWAYMPLADGLQLMFFAFLLLWLTWVARDLESEMGSLRFAGMWFLMTLLGGIFMFVGYQVAHVSNLHGAPYIPEGAITVAWCVRNPTKTIMLYGILPMNGKWLGALTAITTVVLFGYPVYLLGIMAILNEGVAALWAADRIPFLPFTGGATLRLVKQKEEQTTRGGVRYDEKYYDEVRRREQDRVERERLRKLFGESDEDDPPTRSTRPR